MKNWFQNCYINGNKQCILEDGMEFNLKLKFTAATSQQHEYVIKITTGSSSSSNASIAAMRLLAFSLLEVTCDILSIGCWKLLLNSVVVQLAVVDSWNFGRQSFTTSRLLGFVITAIWLNPLFDISVLSTPCYASASFLLRTKYVYRSYLLSTCKSNDHFGTSIRRTCAQS